MTSANIIPLAKPATGDYYNLGGFTRQPTTSSPDCAQWYSRGLAWTYAFNYEEAYKCFLLAVAHDRNCIAAWWGLGHSRSGDYNNAWKLFRPAALTSAIAAIREAISESRKATGGTDKDRGQIDALEARLPKDDNDLQERDFRAWDTRYMHAMKKLNDNYGEEDVDIAYEYANSMMLIQGHKLWNYHTGEPAEGSYALEIRALIEKTLLRPEAAYHPGLLHAHIHLEEQSQNPEKAAASADKLLHLLPAAGHVVHMPSHLDIVLGDYRRAITANALAVVADDKYIKENNAEMGFSAIYRIHNIHTLVYAAMFSGQSKIAIEYSKLMEDKLPKVFHDFPGIDQLIEELLPTLVHTYVRFGKWQEIIDMPWLEDENVWHTSIAHQLYGRGVAFAALGRVQEAELEREKFLAKKAQIIEIENKDTGPVIAPNKSSVTLSVAEAMLNGEIEYRKGNFEVAFEYLRDSVRQYDQMAFSEPWQWKQPTRHALGALLLEQGQVDEALEVFAEDLGIDEAKKLKRSYIHPNNVWALHGYHECLVRKGRLAEARIIEPTLRLALAVADIEVEAGCFCSLERVGKGKGTASEGAAVQNGHGEGEMGVNGHAVEAKKDACCH